MGRMFPAALLLILGSGLYMANEYWTFDTPWIVVALVSLVVMGVVGGTVVGRGLAAIGRSLTSEGPVSPELAQFVARPTPWVAASALNGIGIGLIWLMVNKPGWLQSTSLVIALAIVGALIGAALTSRAGRIPAPASPSDT
jgi:predicted cobalt transporter CbtA